MLGIKYLSEAQLKGFDRYKYNSIDTSVLSVHVMHPFWNWCVQYFPRWLAPNLITFVGFMLTVITFFLIGYFDYGFNAADLPVNPIPSWVWLTAAIGLFLAYTLDGIDGKQARRTGTSGPLGELFDHGLDSYSSIFIPIYVFSLFGITDLPPKHMHFVVANVFLNFYLTHFEKYNTGVMFLPWAYDFVMWGVSLVMASTCIFGPQVFRARIIWDLPMARFFEITLYVSGVLTSHPIIINNIYNSYKNKTGKMRPFFEAIRPLYPLASIFVISTIWVYLSNHDIAALQPRLLFLCFGTIFSNFTCRLIVAQMSDTRTDAWNSLLSLLVIATSICIFPYRYFNQVWFTPTVEEYVLYVLLTICTVCHLHYGTSVVCEMCDHFNIKCFKIRPREQPRAGA